MPYSEDTPDAGAADRVAAALASLESLRAEYQGMIAQAQDIRNRVLAATNGAVDFARKSRKPRKGKAAAVAAPTAAA